MGVVTKHDKKSVKKSLENYKKSNKKMGAMNKNFMKSVNSLMPKGFKGLSGFGMVHIKIPGFGKMSGFGKIRNVKNLMKSGKGKKGSFISKSIIAHSSMISGKNGKVKQHGTIKSRNVVGKTDKKGKMNVKSKCFKKVFKNGKVVSTKKNGKGCHGAKQVEDKSKATKKAKHSHKKSKHSKKTKHTEKKSKHTEKKSKNSKKD